MPSSKSYLAWFKDLKSEDISQAGGKGANLGEMTQIGIPIPNGFVVTASAYFDFLKTNNLEEQIKKLIDSTDVDNSNDLAKTSSKIQSLIKKHPMPHEIATQIMSSYKKLGGWFGLNDIPVAVRSSATAEDLPDASFAGQQESFLHVVGEANLIKRVQDCWASLFTQRAIFYRQKQKYDHFKIGIAVPVQKQINSLVSGIIFTTNPVTNNKNEMVIEAIWGLGEYIVQGKITPDQYLVNKQDWSLSKYEVAKQSVQLVQSEHETRQDKVKANKQDKVKLTSQEVIKLGQIGQKLALHYGKAQDIEFAIDQKRQIFIVQSRPITTLNQKYDKTEIITTPIILSGQSASPGQATGRVVILNSPNEIEKAQKGDILVAKMTSPDYVPAMRRVSAIVTDEGGQTSHAAIVSRELGVPCIVGTKKATRFLTTGQMITVNATTGNIHEPVPLKDNQKFSRSSIKYQTATKLYLNLGEPDLAKELSRQDVDGIGLLRAEFMMAGIGIHPKYLIAQGKQEEFIKTLTNNLLKFVRGFSNRPVIYRASDFKSNEYRFLKYGKLYEPEEPNPLLGFRGASRYLASPDVFNLELEAIKRVRNKFGYKNLHLMIPFVRTPDEMSKVKIIINQAGLLRTPSFKLFMMVELPSNVLMLDEFIKVGIDGVSIGSNDLTMLVLGTDRDNAEVAKTYNELDPSVLWCLKRIIETCRKHNITCGICGQAPSNYPELTEKLVEWGISSISVSPDAITRTRELIHWAEHKLILQKH